MHRLVGIVSEEEVRHERMAGDPLRTYRFLINVGDIRRHRFRGARRAQVLRRVGLGVATYLVAGVSDNSGGGVFGYTNRFF